MVKDNLSPSISILTLSYNPNLELFKKFLVCIRLQDYPKDKIEHLIVDGGSDNGSIELAKKFNTTILTNKRWKNEISLRQSLALKKARNEIVMWLPTDNLLKDKMALRKLINPFVENKNLLASYTFHYAYNPELPMLDRYCGLMGLSDPVVHYLGKADRRPWFERRTGYPSLRKKGGYDIVEFNRDNLPTVGDNGFLVKRNLLLKAKVSPKHFFHTDLFVDLLSKNYNKYAVVYNTSVEHVIRSSFRKLIGRRIQYMERDAQSGKIENRRYKLFDPKAPKDILNLIKFIFLTVTLIEPLLVSLKGYMVIKDKAWFVHPFICYMFLIYYGKSKITTFVLSRKI